MNRTLVTSLLLLLVSRIQAFSVRPSGRSLAVTSPLWRPIATTSTRYRCPRVICHETPSDSSSDKPSNNNKSTTNDEQQDQPPLLAEPDDDTDKGGVVKTVLLAVPLFCKFVIVLVIKFLTDLVVFPLLFLYRLARLAKRKVFGGPKDDLNKPSPNGEGGEGI